MTIAEQTAKLVESLPPDKAETVLEFARLLAERADDEEWDRQFKRAATSPKFKAFLEKVEREIAEGKGTPLDLDQL